MQIDIKGNYILVQSFLPTRDSDATILGTSAGVINIPPAWAAGLSSYTSSKFGALKFFEILAAEVPDVNVMIFHPGIGTSGLDVQNRLQLACGVAGIVYGFANLHCCSRKH